MTNTLNLTLLGKDYRVACTTEDQDSLRTAADLLESKLLAIAGKTRSAGERLAIMAALDLAHELVTANNAPAGSAAALESETIQRRIDSIEARIITAIDPD